MKTVFEGMVNGKKFNNVSEYNNYLMTLLNNGETVQAETRTYTDNSDERCECKCNGECECIDECTCGKCEQHADEPEIDFFCGMHEDGEEPYYLNTITGGPDDAKVTDAWEERLIDNITKVLDYLRDSTSHECEEYRNELEEVMVQLNTDASDIKAVDAKISERIKILEAELQQEQEKLKVVKSCKELNDLFTDRYGKLLGELETMINLKDNAEHCKEHKSSLFHEWLRTIFPQTNVHIE